MNPFEAPDTERDVPHQPGAAHAAAGDDAKAEGYLSDALRLARETFHLRVEAARRWVMRSVLAVVTALVVVAVAVYALCIVPWFALGLDAVLEPGRYDTTTAYNIFAIGVAFAGAVGGGWLCARIGKSLNALLVFAGLGFLGGVANVGVHAMKPEPEARQPGLSVLEAAAKRKEPFWFTAVMPCVGVVGILAGGFRGLGPHSNRVTFATTALIQAPPAEVWAVLTDAAGYERWNPEILGVEGVFAASGRIKVRVRIGSGAVRSLTLAVTEFLPPSRMQWVGGVPGGLFVGTRTLTVSPAADGTEFRMVVEMSGPLAPLITKSLGDRRPELDAFSAALKTEAERRASGTSSV
jgi:uncharacterized protein YndB with AHSA1/START domain